MRNLLQLYDDKDLLIDAIEQLCILGNSEYEFSWYLEVFQECITVTLFAGDSNCTHDKEYDPSDDHGYTELDHNGDLREKPLETIINEAIDIIKNRIV